MYDFCGFIRMKFLLTGLFIIAAFCALSTESARILSIFQMPSPSHYIYGSSLLKELAARGHEVTSVNLWPQKQPIANFTDIIVDSNAHLLKSIISKAEAGKLDQTSWKFLFDYTLLCKVLCRNFYENTEIRNLIESPEDKFDLILIEVILTDSLYGLGQHFNAPMIGISTFNSWMGTDEVVGNSSPASVIPIHTYNNKMTLYERFRNFLSLVKMYILLNYHNYYLQKELYNKYLPNARISFDEARKNFSLLLLSQHHTLSYPRPYVPNVIETGGLHIPRNPAPLPNELQQFLDNAPEGVIYFSLGSNIKSKELSLEKRAVFLNVFRGLKQKVLWKFEDPELPGKPDSVFICPWLPQHAVLAHPNVKVFMTHGGLLSITEAVFYGKTMLGIPVFADQPLNIKLAVNREIALSVDFDTINEPELKHKLIELLYNPIYSETMKEVSLQFHDKPMTAMETAIYWIEYVLRHNGARHLRNSGVDLNLWQYYSVDVVGILLSGFILAVLIIIWSIKKVINIFKNNEKMIKHE